MTIPKNILLFGLGIMLTERVEDGDASIRRVFQILDDILVLILDPVFEDIFGDGPDISCWRGLHQLGWKVSGWQVEGNSGSMGRK